ncbi:MAG: hypothetical protein AAF961_03765, partial [Planctomycetota bacterium]
MIAVGLVAMGMLLIAPAPRWLLFAGISAATTALNVAAASLASLISATTSVLFTTVAHASLAGSCVVAVMGDWRASRSHHWSHWIGIGLWIASFLVEIS